MVQEDSPRCKSHAEFSRIIQNYLLLQKCLESFRSVQNVVEVYGRVQKNVVVCGVLQVFRSVQDYRDSQSILERAQKFHSHWIDATWYKPSQCMLKASNIKGGGELICKQRPQGNLHNTSLQGVKLWRGVLKELCACKVFKTCISLCYSI